MGEIERLKKRNEQLDQRVAALEDLVESRKRPATVSRRAMLGVGAAGLGLGGLATSNVSAATNQVGTIGSQSDRVDVFAEDLDVSGAISGTIGTASDRVDVFAEDTDTDSLTVQAEATGPTSFVELDGISSFSNGVTSAEQNYINKTVGTSGTDISASPDDGSLLLVHGTNVGSSFTQFTDLVINAVNSVNRIAGTSSGSAGRTYTGQGGSIELTMDNGSYKVSVFEFALRNRDS